MKASEPDSSGYQAPEPGTYIARCVRLIDLGTQINEYQGVARQQHQILVGWELPNELIEEGEAAGQPFYTAKFYTLSLHEKAKLRQDLINWRGKAFTQDELKGFEMKNILGAPCMLTISETETGRTKVTSVTALPKGTVVPPQINETLYFCLEPDEFDSGVFSSLSEGIQNIIENSPEYDALMGRPDRKELDVETFTEADDIPF